MPDMNGIEATRRIMDERPTPIVIISGVLDPEQSAANFMALEAGALALLPKPSLAADTHDEELSRLAITVKTMSGVRVIRRRAGAAARRDSTPTPPLRRQTPAVFKAVCIGASTGGPQALADFLARVPVDFPLPVLVVQHIAQGFLAGLVTWLQGYCALTVKAAGDLESVRPGVVYFAPDDQHMEIDAAGVIHLNRLAAMHGLRPAVSRLFASAAKNLRHQAIGILLTGMGRDGAEELRSMRDMGAMTIAQDRESSVVHGMPGAAIALGGASHVLALAHMVPFLIQTLSNTQRPSKEREA